MLQLEGLALPPGVFQHHHQIKKQKFQAVGIPSKKMLASVFFFCAFFCGLCFCVFFLRSLLLCLFFCVLCFCVFFTVFAFVPNLRRPLLLCRIFGALCFWNCLPNGWVAIERVKNPSPIDRLDFWASHPCEQWSWHAWTPVLSKSNQSVVSVGSIDVADFGGCPDVS